MLGSEDGLRSRALTFPEGNGAAIWPRYSGEATVNPGGQLLNCW